MGNAGIGTLGSAPTAAALALKADLAGATFTGPVNGVTPAQITALHSIFVDSSSLESAAAPTAGYIYRSTGVVNAVAKAQADTSANAAAIVGFGHAALGLAPMLGIGVAQFSDLPVVGSIAYLSTSVAGKLQVAVPGASYPSVALAIVRQVVSGSEPYTASVEWGVRSQVVGIDDRRSYLLAQAVSQLGGSAYDYAVEFDDFDEMVEHYDSARNEYIWVPKIGKLNTKQTDCRGLISCAALNYRIISHPYKAGSFGAITSRPWLMSVGATVAATSETSQWMMELESVDVGAVGIEFAPVGSADDKIIGGYGASLATGGLGTYANRVVLGDKDTSYHTLWMRSLGDGTVQWKLDAGAWSAATTINYADNGGTGVRWSLGTLTMYSENDYFFFAYKAR